MKTAEEIYKSRYDYYMANYMEMGVNHRSAIIGAMEEYASQFQSQLSEKDREIEQERQKSQRLYDALKRYTDDFEGDFMIRGEIVDEPEERWYPLTEIYKVQKSAILEYKQTQPGDSGTKQDKK